MDKWQHQRYENGHWVTVAPRPEDGPRSNVAAFILYTVVPFVVLSAAAFVYLKGW